MYDYIDLLQSHFNSDTSFDYDFDAHIAQCANAFGSDEKCHSDNYHLQTPVILSASDGFTSSDSSSPSRSTSVIDNTIKIESPDGQDNMAGPSSLPIPPLKGRQRTRSFDDPHTDRQQSPRPFVHSKAHGSRAMTTGSTSSSSSPRLLSQKMFLSLKKTRKPMAPSANISDEDADDESDNDTDDEYVPTPRSADPKHRRISQFAVCHSALPNRSSSSSPVSMKRLPGTSLSRNRQTTSAAAIDKACKGSNISFVCPECGWKQANRRLPDFKRHLRTHTRPDETDQSRGWWCKGVTVEEAHKYNIPKNAKSYLFSGQQRIGGCMQTFSRRDALKRHLDNANVACVGRSCRASDD